MQKPNPIPDWDSSAVIPAKDTQHPTSRQRSPYKASLLDLVKRFGHTLARRQLLRRLLDFRAELHLAGIDSGFQWLNGSFVEDIELRKGKDPSDIDLVTFFHVPPAYMSNIGIQYLVSDLLRHDRIKTNHSVDHYYVQMKDTPPEFIVGNTVYWYSLLSHRKDDFLWKGFVQLDLAPGGDAVARSALDAMDNVGGST